MSRPDRVPGSGGEPADWHARLRGESCKLTGPRRAILRILSAQSRPLTNKEIFRLLPKGGCDLATIYRSIQLLERLGMVKRFDFGDGTARFALLTGGGHQHHLVCTRCSAMVAIGECIVRELEARIAVQSKFIAVTHRLEFFGICPACQ